MLLQKSRFGKSTVNIFKEEIHRLGKQFKSRESSRYKNCPTGSGCGTVGIEVSSGIRGPGFESRIHSNFIVNTYFLFSVEKRNEK